MRIVDVTVAPAGDPLRPTALSPHVPVTRELSADEVGWELAPRSPWPSASPILALAIEALPAVEDDLVARFIERLVVTIVDLTDELRSVRQVLSVSMTRAFKQELVLGRLHQHVVEMREAGRPDRKAAV